MVVLLRRSVLAELIHTTLVSAKFWFLNVNIGLAKIDVGFGVEMILRN